MTRLLFFSSAAAKPAFRVALEAFFFHSLSYLNPSHSKGFSLNKKIVMSLSSRFKQCYFTVSLNSFLTSSKRLGFVIKSYPNSANATALSINPFSPSEDTVASAISLE